MQFAYDAKFLVLFSSHKFFHSLQDIIVFQKIYQSFVGFMDFWKGYLFVDCLCS